MMMGLLMGAASVIATAQADCTAAARPQDGEVTQSAATQGATAAQPATPASGLEDIVVTAQRRSERLQNVPAAVTALTSRALETAGINSTRNLTLVTPGLNFTQSGFSPQPQIRGIGARAVGPGDESTVPIYIDGIYQPSQQAAFFEFSGIERIEVLKGPQGTLFGRNAMGGAINVITREPSQDFDASIAGAYETFKRKVLDAYVNIPLTSSLAMNVSVHGDADEGYIKPLYDAAHDMVGRQSSLGARAKIRWTPSDVFDVTLGGSYIERSDTTGFSGHPRDGSTIARIANPNVIIADKYQSSLSFEPVFDLDQRSAYVQAKYAASAFDVNLSLAYSRTSIDVKSDSDSTTVNYAAIQYSQASEAYIGELRLTSTGDGPFKWIVGTFGISEDGSYGRGDTLFLSKGSPTGSTLALIVDTTTRAISGFAEGTYTLFDRLSLTGGLRYSYEKRSITQFRSVTPNNSALPFGVGILPPLPYASGTKSFTDLSPRFTTKFDFTPRVHAYATYSRAFKSGLYNASTVGPAGAAPRALNPEKLSSVEVGLKSEPTRSTRLNLSAYTYDYTDLQVSSRDSNGGNLVQNAAAARIRGGEAEFSWAVLNGLNFNAGAAYTDARFSSFPAANVFTPRADLGGNISGFADVKGKRIPRIPEVTFNAGADYTLPLASGNLTLSGNLFWTGNYYWDFANRFDNEGDHVHINTRITWTSEDRRNKVSVYSENVTNDDRPINQLISANSTYQAEVRPRIFGIRYERSY